jgi:hypothetical protein
MIDRSDSLKSLFFWVSVSTARLSRSTNSLVSWVKLLFCLSVSFYKKKKKKFKLFSYGGSVAVINHLIGTSSFPEGEYQCVFVESK